MLKQLLIKNIAIIESLHLDFHQGLTVITGESGSGKSVLLDAIALAFGAKVSPKEVLRAGCDRGQVELLFDIDNLQGHQALRDFLAEQGVALPPDETEMLLSRELTAGGSRSRINGIPVTRDVLERLRPWIIDLHGQHELTSLFHRDTQRVYLDAFGGHPLAQIKREVAGFYEEWQALKQQLQHLEQNRQQIEQQRDFMVFQLNELLEAELTTPDEDTQLKQELEVLSHADKLIQISLQGSLLLSEGEAQSPALLDQLSKLEKRLAEGAVFDPVLETMLSQLQGIHTELHALSSDLSRYHDRVEADPERMAELTDRVDLLEKLKRKYGPTLQAALEKREELARGLEALEAGEQNFEALTTAIAEKEQALKAVSSQLGARRRELAANLKDQLMGQLQMLALPSVSFDIEFIPISYSREGTEAVEFVFSANPGEPLRPLAKVASGGELSRFLLAMKVLTAQTDGLLTLIFDEIDSGISGPTAKAVAEKLAELSRHLQVLAITHQPMIAAMGKQHLHVEKRIIETAPGSEAVLVDVQALEENESRRLKVLSRLVSGTDAGDETVEKFIRKLREQALAFYHQSSGEPVKELIP